jgi:ribosomal-protein-alanine N-acetyltransferase
VTNARRFAGHPTGAVVSSPLRLYGRRLMLRPLVAGDFEAWSEVRVRNDEWLTKWEPLRHPKAPDPAVNRDAFASRCAARDRERQSGVGYAFGIFVDNAFAGEINLNNVLRGAMQSVTIGYWIDEARAGKSYMSEAVLVATRFALEDLQLHRVEICIIPRNHNSRRVMEKLGYREEGIAERFLEINGTWEDHVRYGFTIEEWRVRREELVAQWL